MGRNSGDVVAVESRCNLSKSLMGAAVLVALLLVAAGCGSGGTGGEIESQAASQSSATTVASGGETATETSEVEGAEADDTSAVQVDYQQDTIPTENSGEVVAALVEELHGPTADLAGDINRLTTFPSVPTPAGAHVSTIWVSSRNDPGDDRTFHNVKLELVVDEAPDQVQRTFESDLLAAGWEKESTEFDVDQLIEEKHEQRTFARATEQEETERLVVTTIETAPVSLMLKYKTRIVDEELRTRFHGWFGTDMPIPEEVGYSGVLISTSHGPAQTLLTMHSEHPYENASEPSWEEIVVDVTALAEQSVYPIVQVSDSDVELEVDGYLRLDISAFDGLVKVRSERVFDTPQAGNATPAPVGDQSKEPISDNAAPEDFAGVLGEMHGPTEDVAAQMRRLGPFPDLPTPLGADIVDLEVGLNTAFTDPGSIDVFGNVEVAVGGEFEEMDTYYQAQLAAYGWELRRSEPITTNAEVERVRHSYSKAGVSESAGFPLTIDVFDDPANVTVRVILDYDASVPESEVNLEQWLGWEGDTPIPAGGDAIGYIVSSRRWVGDSASLISVYNFPDMERDDLLPAAEAASPGTDYTRNPDLDRTGFGDLDYTHPYFERVGLIVRTGAEGPNLVLEAQFPFAR